MARHPARREPADALRRSRRGDDDPATRRRVAQRHFSRAGVLDRLGQTVERDIADLRPHLEVRAAESEKAAIAELAENGRREAEAMAALLQRQIDKVREAMRSKQPPAATEQMDLFGPSEEEIQKQTGTGAAPVRGRPPILGRQAAAAPKRSGKRARESAARL